MVLVKCGLMFALHRRCLGTGSQSIINNTRDPIPVGEFSDYMDEAKNADYEIFLEQFEVCLWTPSQISRNVIIMSCLLNAPVLFS